MPAKLLNQAEYRVGYTAYEEMNELLMNFAAEAETDMIWFSAEAEAVQKNRLGSRFLRIVRMALDTAKRYCVMDPYKRERYISLRSRHVQKQTFIKITYSCGENRPPDDIKVQEIARITNECGCYFKIRTDETVGSINIALPDDQR